MSSASAAIATESANPSTGPRTPEGKAVSSRNALQHGLASETMLIPGESAAEWEEFRDGMFAEWQPATPTEEALVGDMAKHHWLKDRAIRLQNERLRFALEDRHLNRFSVLMRYQTTNERAFARAKRQLEEMRKNRRPEFVSQNANTAAEPVAVQTTKRRKLHRIPRRDRDSLQKIDREMNEFLSSVGLELPSLPTREE